MNTDIDQNDAEEKETEQIADVENEASETSTEQASDNDRKSLEELEAHYAEMSDEEFLKQGFPRVADSESESSQSTQSESSGKTQNNQSDDSKEFDTGDETNNKKESETQVDSESESETPVDYKTAYESLFKTYKTRGKEFVPRDMREIESLINKGLDYHHKTEELAGGRKQLKTLQDAGITEQDLNYLIDLHKKEPKAIANLLKQAQLDPLDIDVDSDEEYAPNNHLVTDQSLALDETLAELKTSPKFNQLVNVVGEQWDMQSRVELANQSRLLYDLEDHMRSGVFDMVDQEMTRQRTLGNLKGVSDYEAYKQVGKALLDQGSFASLIEQQNQSSPTKAPVQEQPLRPQHNASDPERQQRRQAASPTKTGRTVKESSQINVFDLSDEEFQKQFAKM